MARRGLVSKGMGQGPAAGGGQALMPKGEKPKGPQLLPVAEVARRLRVEPSQVEAWLQKDQLRGGDAGIRPYDFKKFQLDFPEEIKRQVVHPTHSLHPMLRYDAPRGAADSRVRAQG